MLIENIEHRLNDLIKNIDKDTFIFDLITAYGQPKATITRLQKGDYNLAEKDNEVIWKNKLHFHHVINQDPHVVIDELAKDTTLIKNNSRFIIVTDFKILLAIDTKTTQTLDINILEINKHSDFFLPWSGLEKPDVYEENPADIKAAEKMGRLYDLIIENNQDIKKIEKKKEALNIFFARIIFCFFA